MLKASNEHETTKSRLNFGDLLLCSLVNLGDNTGRLMISTWMVTQNYKHAESEKEKYAKTHRMQGFQVA